MLYCVSCLMYHTLHNFVFFQIVVFLWHCPLFSFLNVNVFAPFPYLLCLRLSPFHMRCKQRRRGTDARGRGVKQLKCPCLIFFLFRFLVKYDVWPSSIICCVLLFLSDEHNSAHDNWYINFWFFAQCGIIQHKKYQGDMLLQWLVYASCVTFMHLLCIFAQSSSGKPPLP